MQITDEQDLLLTTIFDKSDRWVKSLRKWESKVEIETLDGTSFYLLPMLYRKLSQTKVDSLHYKKVQGVYRYVWVNNQRKIQSLQQLLQLCTQIEVPTLLIKGAALLFTHYEEKGLRQMADLDIAIPEEKIDLLSTHLFAKGYSIKGGLDPKKTILNPKYRKFEHAVSFVNQAQEDIDLHWHVLDECSFQDANHFFWKGSTPLEVEGCMTRQLNLADHLLLLAVHGYRWNPFFSLRWLVDIAMILEQDANNLPWQRFVERATHWNLTAPVKEVFSLLTRYGFQIPNFVTTRLAEHPLSSHYAAEHSHRFVPKTSRWNRLLHRWFLYSRRTPHYTVIYRLWTFPDYFKTLYGITNIFSFIRLIFRKLRKNPFCPEKS